MPHKDAESKLKNEIAKIETELKLVFILITPPLVMVVMGIKEAATLILERAAGIV